jgi:hypothetical protein
MNRYINLQRGLIVALYHRQCLVQRTVASFRQMQSSVVNKRVR